MPDYQARLERIEAAFAPPVVAKPWYRIIVDGETEEAARARFAVERGLTLAKIAEANVIYRTIVDPPRPWA